MPSPLNPHSEYPALPEQATNIKPDTGCAGCAFAQATGHKTCSTFALQNTPEVVVDQRISLIQIREMMAQLSRRAFDVNGVMGGHNGWQYDYWYYYNAPFDRQINFVYFSAWEATEVAGDTVTLTIDGGDARTTLLAHWYGREEGNPYWIPGYSADTSPQPGDMLEFQYPSKAFMLQSKVLEILESSATHVKVKIDKSISSATSYFEVLDGEGEPLEDPAYPSAKLYHYGREEEHWDYALTPHWFFGRYTRKTVPAGSLPGDKIWKLEDEVICPPDSTDPLSPKYTLEGYHIVDEEWQTISDTSRLYIKPGHSCITLGTSLPVGSIRTAPSTDLTETYSSFRSSYYVKTTADDSACRIVGFDRCFYSRDGDVAAYAGELGIGETVYCDQRIYEEYIPVDNINKTTTPWTDPGTDGYTDSVTVELHSPANLDLFPVDTGACILYGYCEKWENSIDRMGDKEAPWLMDYAGWLVEFWFAGHVRMQELYVLAQKYYVETILHPSVMWLIGYYGGVLSPHGFNAKTYPRGTGLWSLVKPETLTDVYGNKTLSMVSGLEKGYLLETGGTVEDPTWTVDPDRVSVIPANVAGYTTKADPFTPGATVSDNLLEYIGAQFERDTMQIKDRRGLSSISRTLSPEDIIAPNFDITLTDTPQQHSRASFEIEAGTGDALIRILPYRQELKPESSLGPRTVYAFSALGTGRYQLEFDHEVATFSRFDAGTSDIGDSYNRIYTVQAGGRAPILPYENQGLNSFDGEKETGSRNAGAAPLDCIEIMGRRFIIESVTPHAGSEASTWGSRQETLKGGIGGYAELTVDLDDNEFPLVPISLVSVQVGGVDLELVQTADKPLLVTGQYFFDDSKVFFSAADHGDYVEIKYRDRDNKDYTLYHTIAETFTVETQFDYSDYTAATTKVAYIAAPAATIITLGTPAAGQVKVTDVSGKVHLTFSTDDAGSDWRIVMTWAIDAAPPQDDWAVGGNYLSFGKKRDVAVIRVDVQDGSDWILENSIVGEVATFYKSASAFLPTTDQVVEWTLQGQDNWTALDGCDVNAAAGLIRIPAATLALLPQGSLCFKLPQVSMVDHRGFYPASIINKTQAVVDGTVWVFTNFGSGHQVDFVFDELRGIQFQLKERYPGAGVGCYLAEYDTFPTVGSVGVPNYLRISKGGPPGGGSLTVNFAALNFSILNTMGLPKPIANWPDGVTIEEAYIEIGTSGLTRTRDYYRAPLNDCDGNPVVTEVPSDPKTNIENISYSIVAMTSASTWEVIGSFAGANNGQVIADCTELMQFMYANRNTYTYGFGVIFLPDDAGTGTLEELVPQDPADIVTIAGPCQPCEEGNYFSGFEYTEIQWGAISVGQIAIRVSYNGKDKLCPPIPRRPSMAPAV